MKKALFMILFVTIITSSCSTRRSSLEMDKSLESDCFPEYFERNNYYFGKLLTAKDFKDEQVYLNDKRILHNRFIHGYGVICGLVVTQSQESEKEIIVSPGMAIDGFGREIIVSEEQYIDIAKYHCEKLRKYTEVKNG